MSKVPGIFIQESNHLRSPKDPMQTHSDCCTSLSIKTALILADRRIETQSKKKQSDTKKEKKNKTTSDTK